MMIIEAGATQTKVCFILHNKIGTIKHYQGINPNYMLNDAISLILKDPISIAESNTQIHFYGTGCASVQVQNRMKNLFLNQFGLKNVNIYSDLLASARATAKTEHGQINILGTGSSSCIYDGNNITHILPNYGYIFGDHGSGYKLGYTLLQAYFDDQLDREVAEGIEAYSKMKKEELSNYIYSSDSKSSIVDFAKCVHQLKKYPAVNKLINSEFDTFITKQIKLNPTYLNSNQYFTGSIAYYFQSELESCLQKNSLTIKKICTSPIEELCAFHLNYR